MRATKFTGGPLGGQTLQTMGAHYYLHELPGKKYAEYKRVRAVYTDGKNYANAVNQERLSHLEYAFVKERHRP